MSTDATVAPTILRYDYRLLSPAEELAYRRARVNPPQPLTDAQLTMLLNHTRYVTVDHCELKFEFCGEEFVFKHPDAASCQPEMNGKKVLIHFVPEFPEVVYVISETLQWIETIPIKNKVAWFDSAAAAREIHGNERQFAIVRQQLAELQKAEARTTLQHSRGNRAAIDQARTEPARVVRTFTVRPEISAATGADRNAAATDDPATGVDPDRRPLLPADESTPPRAHNPRSSDPTEDGATDLRPLSIVPEGQFQTPSQQPAATGARNSNRLPSEFTEPEIGGRRPPLQAPVADRIVAAQHRARAAVQQRPMVAAAAAAAELRELAEFLED